MENRGRCKSTAAQFTASFPFSLRCVSSSSAGSGGEGGWRRMARSPSLLPLRSAGKLGKHSKLAPATAGRRGHTHPATARGAPKFRVPERASRPCDSALKLRTRASILHISNLPGQAPRFVSCQLDRQVFQGTRDLIETRNRRQAAVFLS